MIIIIPLLLVILSAICKAIADTITHHYSTSIFKNKKSAFWISDGSAKYKNGDSSQGRKHPAMFDGFSDAWHIFNNSAFYLLIVAIGFGININFWIAVPAGIIIHMEVFNLFYDKVLR